MKIYDLKTMAECSIEGNTVVALGNFDGCHNGHMSVVMKAFYEAKAKKARSVVYTFEKMPKNKKGAFGAIFISSAIFGVVHGVNIFAGGSVGGVLLQIGYSALIGALSAVMLMNTHNLWYSVFMHALYNFCGGVVPEFGGGRIWTAEEVTLTVVVSLIVVAYVIYNFVRLPDADIEGVFGKTKEEKHDNA